MPDLKTILIYRRGSLGDTVVSLPCFHRIAASFPEARRLVLTNHPVSQKAAPVELILNGSGLIDGVVSYELGQRNPLRLAELSRTLRGLNIETAVYATETHSVIRVAREVAFLRLCGVKRVLCAPWRASQLNYRKDEKTGVLEHEAERLARCMSQLGPIDLNDRRMWDLKLTDSEFRRGDETLAPLAGKSFIAVNIGGKIAAKDWGDANWAALLAAVAGPLSGMPLVFVGSADEYERSESLGSLWGADAINTCGTLTPRESAVVLDRAAMFIGHDSGPMHVAASRGVRCVALFGTSRPAIWHPYGEGHEVLHGLDGIGTIGVSDVAAAVMRVFSSLPTRPKTSLYQ